MKRKLSDDLRTFKLAAAGRLIAEVASDLDGSIRVCGRCDTRIPFNERESKLKERLEAVLLKLSDIAEKIPTGATGAKEKSP